MFKFVLDKLNEIKKNFSIEHRASSIEHRASSIEYRVLFNNLKG
jgi:hypothetical protein